MITILEAICNDEFNIHGVLATTMPVGPVIICNGPGTKAIGMNAAGNVLGQGNRANLTIGRAVQLVVRNVGGGVPGGVDRAAHGNPGKLSFCFPELEDSSPWTSLAVSRGVPEGVDAVTVFPGEGPRCVVDQKSRDPHSLSKTFAACLRTVHHPKLPLGFDAILIVGPEHARVYADAGWTREQVLEAIDADLQLPGAELIQGAGGMAEGLPESFSDATVPKFRPGGILLVHAGGGAGLFSMIVAGWANGATGSTPQTRVVTESSLVIVTRTLLDPTGERTVTERTQLPRPAGLAGQHIALLDISKPGGKVFLDRIEERLNAAGAKVDALRQADVHQARPGGPAPRDRHELHAGDRSARRLRQLHVVQCARHRRSGASGPARRVRGHDRVRQGR